MTSVPYVAPRDRVEEAILCCFADDFEPTPREIAESLVDEDVSNDLYEGCSSELEAWFCEYENLAKDALR